MSKKLVGGDYLLDLSSIEIEQSEDGETYTNITDASVLEQLTNLKRYVPNPQMTKPVWVKLKNGENDELVVARGTFANVDTGEFEICVQLNGYKLIISIEFTQALNEDEQPIDDWYIDTNDAKYLFTSDAQNINALIKPIYYHGINLYRDYSANIHGHILNNSNSPIDTFEKFENWLKGISGVVFFQCEGVVTINNELRDVIAIFKLSDDVIGATLKTSTGFENVMSISLSTLFDTISDGVNKIN